MLSPNIDCFTDGNNVIPEVNIYHKKQQNFSTDTIKASMVWNGNEIA